MTDKNTGITGAIAPSPKTDQSHFNRTFPDLIDIMRSNISSDHPITNREYYRPNRMNPIPFDRKDFHKQFTDHSLNPFIFALFHLREFNHPYTGIWDKLDDEDDRQLIDRCLRAGHLCEPNRDYYWSDDTIDEYQNCDLDPVISVEGWYSWNSDMRLDDQSYGDLIHILTIKPNLDYDFIYVPTIYPEEDFMSMINSDTGGLNIAVDVTEVGYRLKQFREFRNYLVAESLGMTYNFETDFTN